jgi:hypothetical protein
MKNEHTAPTSPMRLALGVASILMVPLLAMQVTDEVVWGPIDFTVAGALLFGSGLAYQLAARQAGSIRYRVGALLAIAAAFLLVWVNLAVGIIGDEGDPANAMYIGVLAVGVTGAIVARFRPHGMARAMFGAALAQASVAVIALAFALGSPASGPLELSAINGFFVALWVGSALLFREAARDVAERDAVPSPPAAGESL